MAADHRSELITHARRSLAQIAHTPHVTPHMPGGLPRSHGNHCSPDLYPGHGMVKPVSLDAQALAGSAALACPVIPVRCPDWAIIVVSLTVAVVARACCRLLTDAGFDVADGTGDLPGLLQLVDKTTPDAALIDITRPPTFTDEGLQAATTIRHRYPHTAVLLLSSYLESRTRPRCSRTTRKLRLLAQGTGLRRRCS